MCIRVCLWTILVCAVTASCPVEAVVAETAFERENASLGQNWKQGWKIGEADWFHHATQGTMILPYDWFMSLEQPPGAEATAQPRDPALFSDPNYLCRTFGFIPSRKHPYYNPDGLPIGFAIDDSFQDPNRRDKEGNLLAPVPVVGFTCAACHTNEIHFTGAQGKRHHMLIEGGSAFVDLGLFQSQLALALFTANFNAKKFEAFAGRVGQRFIARTVAGLKKQGRSEDEIKGTLKKIAEQAPKSRDRLKAALEAAVQKGLKQRDLELKLGINSVKGGPSRTDALSRIGNRVFGQLNPLNLNQTDAPVNFPHLWDTSWFYWVQYNASIRLPMVRNIGEALGVGASINVLGKPEHLFDSTVNVKNLHLMESQLGGNAPFTGLRSPEWPENILGKIRGRDDDKGLWARGKVLYEKHCIHCHYRIEEYQANIDKPKMGNRYWSSANKYGKRFMKLPYINFFDLGTDESQAVKFYRRIVYTGLYGINAKEGKKSKQLATMSASDALTFATMGVRKLKFNELGLTPEQKPGYDRHRDADRIVDGTIEPAVIPRLAYKARPLNGIWATAPFFHNGSVPNLYEVLLPASERSKFFNVGSRKFDSVMVGFETRWRAKTFEFDTTLPGNSNAGHDFRDLNQEEFKRLSLFQKRMLKANVGWAVFGRVGPALSDDERSAIIEYLKSL